MDSGWIKSYRKTLDNPIICKDTDHIAIWMYLLWSATHQPISKLFGGKRITLNPGQLITGRKSISKQFNISESKVQRVLKTFEIEQQIEQQTSNRSRLISILNWNEYQCSEQQNEQQVNNKRTTSEHKQEHKNIRSNKDTNVSMSNEQANSTQDGIDYKGLINFFNQKTNGVFGNVRYPISDKRRSSVRARIREHGKEAFAEMIEMAINSNFLKGDNKTGFRATFDWMIKPTNFQKIIEGNYNNAKTHNDRLLTYNQVEIMATKGEITFDQVVKVQAEGGKIYYKRI